MIILKQSKSIGSNTQILSIDRILRRIKLIGKITKEETTFAWLKLSEIDL